MLDIENGSLVTVASLTDESIESLKSKNLAILPWSTEIPEGSID